MSVGEVETTQQIAARLGVSEVTVRHWVRRRQLAPLGDTRPNLFLSADADDCYADRVMNPRYAARRLQFRVAQEIFGALS